MVVVNSNAIQDMHKEIEEEIKLEPKEEDIEKELLDNKEGELVFPDMEFTDSKGRKRKGFYVDGYLLKNLRNYIIKAVKKKFDGVLLITGIEGAAKSTNAMTIAKVLDPSFPGEPLDDGTNRRKCDRIVFTPKQFIDAIDNAKPQQCIVLDEAVLAFMSQDSGSDIQKTLIKKMVTIRKLRLYILIVIPSIFLLRKYMAIFRTRALLHYYCPDGLTRGFGKAYNYETKRKLFVRGIKEFDQDCVKPDFIFRATDTTGFFFDDNEYQLKKNEAIKEITTEKEKNKEKRSAKEKKWQGMVYMLVNMIHDYFKKQKTKHVVKDTREFIVDGGLKVSPTFVTNAIHGAKEIMAERVKELTDKQKLDEDIKKYKEKLKEKMKPVY